MLKSTHHTVWIVQLSHSKITVKWYVYNALYLQLLYHSAGNNLQQNIGIDLFIQTRNKNRTGHK